MRRIGHVGAERQNHLPTARGESDEEGDRGEEYERVSGGPGEHHGAREREHKDRESASWNEITEWHDECQSGGVTALDQDQQQRGLGIADAKVLRHLMEEWLQVVEVGDDDADRH